MHEASMVRAALAVFAFAASVRANSLVVLTEGFQDSTGLAEVQVYDRVNSIAHDPPRMRKAGRIHGGRAAIVIEDLPSGKWALRVFHDRNENSTLDHGWNRMPQEAMGFSNGFVPGLLSGMPTFEKLAVEMSGPIDTLRIRVKSFEWTNSEHRSGK